MNLSINDTVELLEDFPEHGLVRGDVGTVIEKFVKPEIAYEVEFVGSDGRPHAQVALRPHQLRKS